MKGFLPKLGISVLLAALAPSIGWAQDDAAESESYIGILGNYVDPDSKRGVSSGEGVEAIYGWSLVPGWGFEARGFTERLRTEADGFEYFDRHGLAVDVRYSLSTIPYLTPFLLAGGGLAYNDVAPRDEDELEPIANIGLGLASKGIGPFGLRVRADARYMFDAFDGGVNDIKFGLGLEIPLHRTASPMPEVKEVVPEVRVVEVEPVPEPEPLPDGDEDGVPDQYDRCPSTPTDLEVDVSGCALPQVMSLDGVNFELASAKLDINSKRILDAIVEQVAQYTQSMTVEIAGHTDAQGAEAYNMELSRQRAESVRAYLINAGIAADRLTSNGYGEGEPLADNETEDGRAMNRRVELRLAGEN